jgi:hypothetical protein
VLDSKSCSRFITSTELVKCSNGNYTVIELELLQKDIEDVADDFKNSRNLWVKEKTSTALRLMQSLIAEMKNSSYTS